MLKNHLFDQDHSLERSFIAWLDAYAVDGEDWQNTYSRIYDLLCKEPSLVYHTWSEMNLMAT